MNYTFNFDKGVFTITEDGDVVFQKDLYYEYEHEQNRQMMEAIFQHTEIPQNDIGPLMDDIRYSGYVSIEL